MRKNVKTISRISAVALALIIALSCMVPALAATGTGGHRYSQYWGIKWKQEYTYSYTDSQGNSISGKMGVTPGRFNVYCIAQNGQSADPSKYTQRAFCIEPEKWVEGPDDYDTARSYNYSGSANYNGIIGIAAYDSRLTPEKKMLLNYVLANGYGNYVPADANHVAYWYATQLLIYETVIGWRNSDFNAPSRSFEPNSCLTVESHSDVPTANHSPETSVAAIQQAYLNIVGWVKLTLKNPDGTSISASNAPVKNMVYSEKLGKYYWDYDFNDIIRQDLSDVSSYAIKLSKLNIKESDIIVYDNNNPGKVSFTIDKVNKRIRFTSDEPLDGNVIVAFVHNPRIRGINESIVTTSPAGLIVMDIPGTNNQAFAKGAAQLVDRPTYFKLQTAETVKLKMDVVSSNSEFVEDNPCYSLKGAVYGIYSDLNCQNLVGTFTIDENGEAVYNDGMAIPNKMYWVRELTPSPGYFVDETVRRFKDSGKLEGGVPVYNLTSVEVPESDYLYITLDSQGMPSTLDLDGAQVRVNFYGGVYYTAEDVEGIAPLRSWVFESDADGYLDYDEAHFVSGDDLFYMNGKVCLPHGTITVQAIKAPNNGEIKVSDEVFVAYVNDFTEIYIPIELESHDEPIALIGDVNNDGCVDTLDAIFIEKYAAGKIELTNPQLYVADVNNDGSVDVIDATDIQRYAVAKITEFAKKS